MKRRPPRRVRNAEHRKAQALAERFDVLTPKQRKWMAAYVDRCFNRRAWVRGPNGWQVRDISRSTNANWRVTEPVTPEESFVSLLTLTTLEPMP